MDRPRKRRHKIVYSILGVLLLVSLVPMGLLGWWLIKPIRDEVSTKEREIQLEMSRRVSGDIETYVRGHKESLVSAATGLAILMENAGPDQFTDMLEHYDLLDRYLDPKKELLGLHLNVMERTFPAIRRKEIFDPPLVQSRLATAMESALEGRPFFYSQPFFLMNPQQPAMVVSVPLVLEDDRVAGVLSAVVSLMPVVTRVVHGYWTGQYVVYVLDRDYQLIAHSNYQLVLEGVDLREIELVQRYAQEPVPVAATYEFVLDRDTDPLPMLGAYYPISSLGWAVFIESELKEAYFTVHRMMRTLGLAMLGGAVIAILAAIYFAEGLSRPIRLLAAKTRSLAKKDFSQRVEVRSRNELGELADTFNLMSETIEDYIGRLELALERNKQLFLGSVRTMAAAIDEKDPYTQGHSERVDRYSLIIGRRLGLDEEGLHRLHIGALLHDVGKIVIDDSILKKPSALTDEEFDVMKQHPVKGARIMEPIEALSDVIPILEFHHERYDGKGYPDGLRGEEIPHLARIITVADTFDAMTTERPYQRAMTFQVALSKMLEFKGKALDPRIVDAFVQACRDGDLDEDRREAEDAWRRKLEQMEPLLPEKVMGEAG